MPLADRVTNGSDHERNGESQHLAEGDVDKKKVRQYIIIEIKGQHYVGKNTAQDEEPHLS